jgi:biofilm PGA synthesis N-glycosyltransferase PgaC
VPTKWKQLWRQRLRWEEASVVRTHCRKHIDMANPTKASFRWSNFFVSFELITVNLVFGYVILIYSAWLCANKPHHALFVAFTFYAYTLLLEFINVLTLTYYSRTRLAHLTTSLVLPLSPFYQLFLIVNRIVSYTREIFWRTSFKDNFVPKHVRDVTWKW